MADTKTLKSKLQSVENIRKITKAMELVARSKMKKTIDRVLNIRPYAYFAIEFLVNFSEHPSSSIHSYFTTTTAKKTLIIYIASNKGLCGGYNSNILRDMRIYLNQIDSQARELIEYVAVGKYAVQHVSNLHGTPLASFTHFSENVSFHEIQNLSDRIKKEWETGEYKKVVIGFTNFKSTLSQKPIFRQLLPFSIDILKNQILNSKEENWIDFSNMESNRNWDQYIIEPSHEAITDLIIPQLINVQIYHAILDAYASEQASRMIAMKNASENADTLGGELLLSINHLRQEGITKELSEIAAGSEGF